MLAILGYGMIATFMALILTKRLTPLAALTIVPMLFALLAGFGSGMGEMMVEGLRKVTPTALMVAFAILYFGLMFDTGLFDPVIKVFIKAVKGDPARAVVATAVLASLVSLDGDGSTTYMITATAMMPLFRRMGLNPLALTCPVLLCASVTNLLPWSGPTARVVSVLRLETTELFQPMIIPLLICLAGTYALAYYIGIGERRRIGAMALTGPNTVPDACAEELAALASPSDPLLRRPRLMWFNALLTLALMACLVLEPLPLVVLFMAAFALASMVNYPRLDDQRERLAAHAPTALAQVSIFFVAGIFAGILSGTGMVDAMSSGFLAAIPPAWGPYLAPITALISVPGTYFMSNDAFYYGVLPVLAKAAEANGISALEIGRAALVGQPVHLLSPLVASTYLLCGLAGVDPADHLKYTLKWSALLSLLLLGTFLLFGLFPWAAA